jgi:Mce-associated membrane protein
MFAGAVAWFVIELTRPDYQKRPTGDGAVQAATAQTLALMSLDYRTAKADLQRVIDGSTGTMRDGYSKALSASVATAASQKSVSTGAIKSVGLSSFSGNKAEVLVAGDATVSFPKTASAAASKIQVRYRFRVEMQYVNGVWKSAELDFAGLPQPSQVGS